MSLHWLYLIMNLLCLCNLCYCWLSSYSSVPFSHFPKFSSSIYLHHMTKVPSCVTPDYCICGSCNHVHHNSCILPCFCTHPIHRMYYFSIKILVFKQNPSVRSLNHISVISKHSFGACQLFILCNINFFCLTDKIEWCLHTQLFQFLL
jgi:hypothetical protein